MSGTNYTRRGFLGLSAAAVAAGLAACTGGGTAPAPAGQGGTSAPASNNLRVFTYEGNETIGLLKDLTKKFDEQNGTTTTVDSLPGSGAAPACVRHSPRRITAWSPCTSTTE